MFNFLNPDAQDDDFGRPFRPSGGAKSSFENPSMDFDSLLKAAMKKSRWPQLFFRNCVICTYIYHLSVYSQISFKIIIDVLKT